MKVFDCHGDLFAHFTYKQQEGETNVFKKYHLDNFKKGNINFGVFNIWIDYEAIPCKQRAKEIMSYGIKEVFESDEIEMIYKYDQFDMNSDKVQFILGLEGIDYLDNAEEIYMMYQYGARLISLTWNHNNKFATCIKGEVDNGLTDEGKKAIKIMDELGIVIDISHLSDKSAREILELSKNPVIASHSNSRTVCNHPRNLPNDIIKLIAKSGGVIGMNSYVEVVGEVKEDWNIQQLVKHVDYIKNLVGIDHIALGFDFMDYLVGSPSEFITDVEFMDDLKNQSDVQLLVKELFNSGYTDEEVEKICYKNMFRVLEQII